MMTGLPERSADTTPVVYVTTAVLMLSTVTPVTKNLLARGELAPMELVGLRILIAFSCLILVTMAGPWQDLLRMKGGDIVRLTLLGILGVGVAYGFAGWSLAYTSVSHYSLIYSLNPVFTALLSLLLRKDRTSALKMSGIALSLCGCLVAMPESFQDATVGFGDLLVLLFTLSASACIVLSAGMVKRYGAAAATTVMFGSSLLFFLLLGTMFWSIPAGLHLTPSNGLLVAYIGVATAAVFFLRNLSLRSLSPATVGAFHNLVPIFAIVMAYLFLGEPVTARMIEGGCAILAGVEMVRRG